MSVSSAPASSPEAGKVPPTSPAPAAGTPAFAESLEAALAAAGSAADPAQPAQGAQTAAAGVPAQQGAPAAVPGNASAALAAALPAPLASADRASAAGEEPLSLALPPADLLDASAGASSAGASRAPEATPAGTLPDELFLEPTESSAPTGASAAIDVQPGQEAPAILPSDQPTPAPSVETSQPQVVLPYAGTPAREPRVPVSGASLQPARSIPAASPVGVPADANSVGVPADASASRGLASPRYAADPRLPSAPSSPVLGGAPLEGSVLEGVRVLSVDPVRLPRPPAGAISEDGPEGGFSAAPPAPTRVPQALVGAYVATSSAPLTSVAPAAIPQAAASLLPDGGRVTMSLHPETLGTIVVTVSRVGDTVSIQITASREALTQISSDAIQDAVTGRGFSVGKVEMQVLTPDASSTRSDNSDSSGSQRDRGRESGPQERRDGTMRWDAEESEDPE